MASVIGRTNIFKAQGEIMHLIYMIVLASICPSAWAMKGATTAQPTAQSLMQLKIELAAGKSHEEKKEREVESAEIIKLRKQAEQHIANLQSLELEKQKIITAMESDRLLTRIKALPQTIQAKTLVTYFDQIKILAQRHRLSLLPAIFPGAIQRFDESDCEDDDEIEPLPCKWYFETLPALHLSHEMYEDHLTHNPRSSNNRFIISGALYARGKKFFYLDNVNESCDAPHKLFGFSIPEGTFALLGWSDGKTQVALSQAELATLENLSYDQLTWIVGLYNRRSYVCSEEDFKIFRSLKENMQTVLRSNYPLKFPHDIEKMFAKESAELNKREKDICDKEEALEKKAQDIEQRMKRLTRLRHQLHGKIDRVYSSKKMMINGRVVKRLYKKDIYF